MTEHDTPVKEQDRTAVRQSAPERPLARGPKLQFIDRAIWRMLEAVQKQSLSVSKLKYFSLEFRNAKTDRFYPTDTRKKQANIVNSLTIDASSSLRRI